MTETQLVTVCLFGICSVMLQRVVDLLDCWSCNFRRHRNIVIWRIVPHCFMWCIWGERNTRSFEGCEQSILEFKPFFCFTLLEWCLVLPSFSCLSLPVLLDHCNRVSWCFCLFSTFPMYWAVFFLIKFLYYLSKNIYIYILGDGVILYSSFHCMVCHKSSLESSNESLWYLILL